MVSLVLAPPPVPWTNQPLALFHGTLTVHVQGILQGVKITAGRRHTDFGQGFYTTTVERQARAWAWQLSLRPVNQKRGAQGQPVVLQFDVDREKLARLNFLCFVRGSFDAD